MKLVAILPVRNEAWLLRVTLGSVLSWCDEVVLALHACTDESASIVREISEEHFGRVWVREYPADRWDEMNMRQSLLGAARELKATHVAIVDADELLTANLLPTIRPLIESMPRNRILHLPGYNLRHGLSEYHANGIWSNRWFSTAFVDSPELHWRGDRFHSREPEPKRLLPWMPVLQGEGGLIHFWGASERRLIAKHRFYKITETLRWPNKSHSAIETQYNQATHNTGWNFAPVPAEWLAGYDLSQIDLSGEPWQEKWSDRLIDVYGRVRFAGLSV